MYPRGIPTITDLKAGLRASAWIGYRIPGRADLIKKHEFRWLDGTPNRFENWISDTPGRTEWYFPKQPDNGPAENCVVMSVASGKWADVACNDGEHTIGGAVCQIRLPG
ncbi:hypothetical protein AAVH_34811 [Aphelenchoides avenae]|nr:hypothetical protein AAVH_34811 [Aphelenchus avenae]